LKIIKCPTEYSESHKSVFLAGGISGCWDWQSRITDLVEEKGLDIVLLNPRRENFDITDPTMSRQQIIWEREHLIKADIILFWFPSETMCPITLYELGFWTNSDKPLIIGCDENYQRRFDVEIQTSLSRDTVVHDSLEKLVEELGRIV
jgi:hypothetical protein